MKLYNTLTKTIENFTPQDPKNVKIYTCGPTVYNEAHIGNFTAYIYWDLLIRTLRLNGWQENRVLNITDVGHLTSDGDEGEDKLEKGARRENKTVWQIAEYYTENFLKNYRALNLIEPTKIARATDYIPADIALIDALTQKDYTYETSDGIYYDTAKFPTYANFAHLDLKNLKAGARVDFNPEKKNPSDFALWKYLKPGEKHEMNWPNPKSFSEAALPTLENQTQEGNQRGERVAPLRGYPGWHIECSAIIHATLGESIDIHTGGIDHIPVHHTNEIAQSEAAYDAPLARFWLHNNFITIDGHKISKSLGNVYTFDDLTKKGFTHLDFRLWVLQGHFRSERNFSLEELTAARQRLQNYRNFASLRHQTPPTPTDELSNQITQALSNNLNSPEALAILDKNLDTITPSTKFIQFLDEALGLNLLPTTPDITDTQKTLITARAEAKNEKNYQKADQIRTQLLEQGISLLDTSNSTLWQRVK